jgi:hypothetical protein
MKKESSYIQYNEGKLNWISHTLRRNCLLNHVIEGQMEREKGRPEEGEDDFKQKRRLRNLK